METRLLTLKTSLPVKEKDFDYNKIIFLPSYVSVLALELSGKKQDKPTGAFSPLLTGPLSLEDFRLSIESFWRGHLDQSGYNLAYALNDVFHYQKGFFRATDAMLKDKIFHYVGPTAVNAKVSDLDIMDLNNILATFYDFIDDNMDWKDWKFVYKQNVYEEEEDYDFDDFLHHEKKKYRTVKKWDIQLIKWDRKLRGYEECLNPHVLFPRKGVSKND